MAPRYRSLLAALVALAFAAPAARAGIPAPGSCTCPSYLVGSPDGALVAHVVVRDIANLPLANVQVVIDFSNCPQWHPCPSVCTSCSVDAVSRTVWRYTGTNGVADFDLRLGAGGCPNPPVVRIYADGVLVGAPGFASLDFDGDLSVTATDVTAVHALIGTFDRRADFDGDWAVTAADEAIVRAHLGASCDPTTPARSHTWGGLKSIYR